MTLTLIEKFGHQAAETHSHVLTALSDPLLDDIKLVDSNFEPRLLANLRWGLVQSSSNSKCATPRSRTTDLDEPDQNTADYGLIRVNAREVFFADLLLQQAAPGLIQRVWSDKVIEMACDKEVLVLQEAFKNSYDSDTWGFIVSATKKQAFDAEAFFAYWRPIVMLPSPDALFTLGIEDFWYYEQMDQYLDWQKKRLLHYFCEDYAQIGGTPGWIQGGDDEKYVAQVNNDWGDCGSVYLIADKDFKDFSVDAQCY